MARSAKKPAKPASSSGDLSFPKVPPGRDLSAIRTALGQPDAELRRILFRNVTEEALVAEGVKTDSRNIVADMPDFIVSALSILQSLDAVRRGLIKIPPGIFAVIAGEAGILEQMKADHDEAQTATAGGKADREATLRREMREGVAMRDIALGALGRALSADQMKQIDAISGDASSADKLTGGLNAISGFIEGIVEKGSADDQKALDLFSAGADCARVLRDKAGTIAKAGKPTATEPRRVSQRMLDIQDGRVLLLVDMILRAFRLARRSDRSILLPKLNKIAWIFDTGSSSAKAAPLGRSEGEGAGTGEAEGAGEALVKPSIAAKPPAPPRTRSGRSRRR